MKIVQEETLQQAEHHLSSRYNIDMMSCLFHVGDDHLRIHPAYFYFLK